MIRFNIIEEILLNLIKKLRPKLLYTMKVNNLSEINFDELIECFLLSFENYFVKMPPDAEYYKQRWQTARL